MLCITVPRHLVTDCLIEFATWRMLKIQLICKQSLKWFIRWRKVRKVKTWCTPTKKRSLPLKSIQTAVNESWHISSSLTTGMLLSTTTGGQKIEETTVLVNSTTVIFQWRRPFLVRVIMSFGYFLPAQNLPEDCLPSTSFVFSTFLKFYELLTDWNVQVLADRLSWLWYTVLDME